MISDDNHTVYCKIQLQSISTFILVIVAIVIVENTNHGDNKKISKQKLREQKDLA